MPAQAVVIEADVMPSNALLIRFSGRLDRHSSSELFVVIKTALGDNLRAIDIDLGGAYYLDSSVLGMMFVLREKARACGKKVSIAY